MRQRSFALWFCLLLFFCGAAQAASSDQMAAITQEAYVLLPLKNGQTLYAAADPSDPLCIHQLACWNAQGQREWTVPLPTPFVRGRMYLVPAPNGGCQLLGRTEEGQHHLMTFDGQGQVLDQWQLPSDLTQPILTSYGIAARQGSRTLCWLQAEGQAQLYALPMKLSNLFSAAGNGDYLWVDIEGVDGAGVSTRQLLCVRSDGSLACVYPLGELASVYPTALAVASQGDLILTLQRDTPSASAQTEVLRLTPSGALVWHYALSHSRGTLQMQQIQLQPDGCTLWGQQNNRPHAVFALHLNPEGLLLHQDFRTAGDSWSNLYPFALNQALVAGYTDGVKLSFWRRFESLEPITTASVTLQRLHPLTKAEAVSRVQHFLKHTPAAGKGSLTPSDLTVTWYEKDQHTGKPCYYFFASYGPTSCVDGYMDVYTGEIYRWGTEDDANG